MSGPLNTAVYSRLAGVEVLTGRYLTAQQTIASALGTDPDTSKPAVYQANLNTTPVVLDSNQVRKPVITFRASGGLPDARFASGLLVDDGVYDLEIWTFDSAGNTAADIGAAVEVLLDRRLGCPAMPLATGNESVWFEAMVTWSFMYDERRNGWVGLTRYKAIEARS